MKKRRNIRLRENAANLLITRNEVNKLKEEGKLTCPYVKVVNRGDAWFPLAEAFNYVLFADIIELRQFYNDCKYAPKFNFSYPVSFILLNKKKDNNNAS